MNVIFFFRVCKLVKDNYKRQKTTDKEMEFKRCENSFGLNGKKIEWI